MPCKSACCYLSLFTGLQALSNFTAVTILKLLKVSTQQMYTLNSEIGKGLKYSKFLFDFKNAYTNAH